MVGKGGGGVAGHLKLKFKFLPSMGDGSGLEPDWYGASFGLKIFYVRVIIIRLLNKKKKIFNKKRLNY